eukprot:GFUD01014946.1.p1 GENE.GFUD01014946.1~~GFUD01014946.1.p1  ORF type:complete len:365 (-),score=133.53 GFUD01014946.1:100-1194(-)
MVQLTEDMIVARTRVSNMASVKKLNCWGADLTDISVVRRLQNVEMLSLSLNSLTSLSDFQDNKNLQELFVRKNQIQSLKELIWLRDLSRLKHLWLAENPCAEGNDRYRQTVIRNLPQLEKLDNVSVTSQERADARFGIDLEEEEDNREQRSMSVEEREDMRSVSDEPAYKPRDLVQNYTRREASQVFQETGNACEGDCPIYPASKLYLETGQRVTGSIQMYKESGHQSPPPLYQGSSRRSLSSSQYQYQYEEEQRSYRERDAGQEEVYDNRSSRLSHYEDAHGSSRHSPDSVCCTEHPRYIQSRESHRYRQDTVNMNKTQGRTRTRNRNSNVLSAILCLVKELDMPSLEVVEMALRCRMEEVED